MLIINSGYGNRGRTGNYYKTIMADNPVGYWRLDNKIVCKDMTSYGNDLFDTSLVPAAAVTVQNKGIIIDDGNKSTVFGNLVQVLDTDLSKGTPQILQIAGDITVEFWMKDIQDITSIVWVELSSNDSVGAETPITNNLYSIRLSSSSKLRIFWESGNGSNEFGITTTAATSWNAGTPYHIIVVRSVVAKTADFYINGALFETVNYTASNPTKDPVLSNNKQTLRLAADISALPDGVDASGDFTGGMDEVAVYNYVLTPAQVLTHYQAGI